MITIGLNDNDTIITIRAVGYFSFSRLISGDYYYLYSQD